MTVLRSPVVVIDERRGCTVATPCTHFAPRIFVFERIPLVVRKLPKPWVELPTVWIGVDPRMDVHA